MHPGKATGCWKWGSHTVAVSSSRRSLGLGLEFAICPRFILAPQMVLCLWVNVCVPLGDTLIFQIISLITMEWCSLQSEEEEHLIHSPYFYSFSPQKRKRLILKLQFDYFQVWVLVSIARINKLSVQFHGTNGTRPCCVICSSPEYFSFLSHTWKSYYHQHEVMSLLWFSCWR